jgi:DNA polymerase II small subunit
MAKNALGELAAKLSDRHILIAADLKAEVLDGLDVSVIAERIASRHKDSATLGVVNSEEVVSIIKEMELDKAPHPIEVIHKAGFRPAAAEIDANYSVSKNVVEKSEGNVGAFVSYFRSRLNKLRKMLEYRSNVTGLVASIDGLKSYTDGREVTIVGIITSVTATKKGNIMAIMEDETSEARVIFVNGAYGSSKDAFDRAGTLVNDEVIAVKGKIAGELIIAKDFVWPDVPIKESKQTKDDVAIAFISDIEVGSKLFYEKNFSKFISWLNGGTDRMQGLAGKVKYIVVGGDVAAGVGIYPNQDRDLVVADAYMQYKMFFELMSAIPDYIHIFVIPGNHDSVQRAEPQPQLSQELIGDFKAENVHLLPNPSMINLHGLDVLTYHGTSLTSIIGAIPGMSNLNPERAMVELLKRRHLSPIYGGNIIVPSMNDNMVIEKVPDILHMGHIHRNGLANYHGVKVVNSGCWEAKSDYQVLLGHVPTPCMVPVYDAKNGSFTTIDFNVPL